MSIGGRKWKKEVNSQWNSLPQTPRCEQLNADLVPSIPSLSSNALYLYITTEPTTINLRN
jgi:hypothetical protein